MISVILSASTLTLSAPAEAQRGDTPGQLTMDSYVHEVLARHPRVPTMQAGREASRQRIPQAGSLPDPAIGVGIMNLPGDSFSFDQINMTMKTLSITQSFPPPGALRARTALAESQIGIADAGIALTEVGLARRARLTYLDLFFIERALEILTENQALLEQFIRITESRYSTGAGLQQDILKARLEHSRLTERKITLEGMRAGLLSDFNILRDRPADETVVLAGLPDLVEVPPDPGDLIEAAVAHSPTLQRDLAEIEIREKALALARTFLRPGWSAGASYAQRDGDRKDLLSANLMVQVPLYSGRKQKRAVEEQSALLDAAGYRSRDTELGIAADIRRLHSQLDQSRRLMALYSGEILLEAEGVLESALAGYQVGQADFLTLLSAQSTLFNYQLKSIQVITDYHRGMARLESVIGAPVNAAGLEGKP